MGHYLLFLVVPIWWMVTASVAVQRAQRVSSSQAIGAVLAVPVVLALLLACVVSWMMLGLM